MKIREGFVTNSSSTNFIIISKKELTSEYLFNKLGFIDDTDFSELAWEFCDDLLSDRGLRWFEINEINFETIKKIFGEKTAEKYKTFSKKNHYIALGYTSSASSLFSEFFTCDFVEIDEKDFYINGKNCIW